MYTTPKILEDSEDQACKMVYGDTGLDREENLGPQDEEGQPSGVVEDTSAGSTFEK